jgi:hypothetical protein
MKKPPVAPAFIIYVNNNFQEIQPPYSKTVAIFTPPTKHADLQHLANVNKSEQMLKLNSKWTKTNR